MPGVLSSAGVLSDQSRELLNIKTGAAQPLRVRKGYIMENFISKAKYQAKKIYAIDPPATYGENVLLGSLQGLAANLSDTQIMVKTGAYFAYEGILRDKYSCEICDAEDVFSLLGEFGAVKKYILITDDPEAECAYVAISLAGIMNALVVTESAEKRVKKEGFRLLLDARGLDDEWLRSSYYFGKLNKKIAVEQPAKSAPKLVDYAVMSNAYFAYLPTTDREAHTKKFTFLDSGAVVYGWNSVLGEYDSVHSFSSLDVCLVPADHAYNLSTLSGFSTDNRFETAKVTPESGGRHSVCLVMSDGDNLQWLLNAYATSLKWYGSEERGKYPLAWGLPATCADVASPMLDYMKDNATENDEFIMQLSGVGYCFPSDFSDAGRQRMAESFAEKMKIMGVRYAEILDDKAFNAETLSPFTSQEGIDGLFYIDYWNYAGMKGQILWCDGKPAVSARYRLWAGLEDGQIDAIASAINGAPTDPGDPDAYSFIIIHCWSGLDRKGNLVPDGNTMDAVSALVSKLGENVEVVNPSAFMERIVKNLKR